jgi:hypothetical protein
MLQQTEAPSAMNGHRLLGSHQDRRTFLRNAGCGFGAIALSAMLAEDGLLAEEQKPTDPLAPKKPHFEPTA